MARDLSGENEDGLNLVVESGRTTTRRAAFDPDDSSFETVRRLAATTFSINRCYLSVACVSILLTALYFFVDVKYLFRGRSPGSMSADLIISRMRESELKALYLLGQQKMELTAALSDVSREEQPHSSGVDSALIGQISLNNDIQQALLASHEPGNPSGFLNSSKHFTTGRTRCGKKADQKSSESRTIEWKPGSNKFLFTICLSGQMTNHIICLEKHMFFAAILNRTLILPSSKFDFQYDSVIDVDRINKCLGRKAVVPFEEFSKLKNGHVRIERFLCYFSSPQPCYLDEEHVKKLEALGISIGKIESAWTEDTKKPSVRNVEDVKMKFSVGDGVLAIGDMFYAELERDWMMQPGGPISHKCRTLIEPSRLIILTAQRFVQTFLGENFVALHFRRHGFLTFCNAKRESCFFPIPQVADCLGGVLRMVNAPIVFLSTDAAQAETDLLQSLVSPTPLFRRPPPNSDDKWDALLYRHRLHEDHQVEAMLDKAICAMSKVFIGAPGSTFTDDIFRLRRDWRAESSCDQYLCSGQVPSFIASDD